MKTIYFLYTVAEEKAILQRAIDEGDWESYEAAQFVEEYGSGEHWLMSTFTKEQLEEMYMNGKCHKKIVED